MPLQREYHGHQIVSSDDMRRHEVFTEGDHPQSLGAYKTLGLAIARTRGWPDVAEPIQPEESEEPLSDESIVEGKEN